MNKDTKKYFKECKFLFPTFGKEEKIFLNKIAIFKKNVA